MSESKPAQIGRLLIIDDDPGVRQVFAKILRRHGHEVRAAASADEGLQEIRTFRPDAVLLDLRMPMINGFGFLYRLRFNPQSLGLRVAIVTGDASLSETARSELHGLGAEIWLKPLAPEQLTALVDGLLSAEPRPRSGHVDPTAA